MEIKLLKEEYLKSENIYKDFLENKINDNEENFSGESVHLDEAPDFPIYLNISDEKEKMDKYNESFNAMRNHYLKTPRDIHFDKVFWYSLLCTKKRDYLISEYPEILESEKNFRNIVLKKFDWENYIYKCVLAAQYIEDNISENHEKYYELVVNNLDLYNYIIKYEVFRNDKFLINILDIIHDNNLSEILKAKIKGRDDLGKDERYGRRVIFEFNKSYPVVMSPMLEKEELEVLFFEHLRKYYDGEI